LLSAHFLWFASSGQASFHDNWEGITITKAAFGFGQLGRDNWETSLPVFCSALSQGSWSKSLIVIYIEDINFCFCLHHDPHEQPTLGVGLLL